MRRSLLRLLVRCSVVFVCIVAAEWDSAAAEPKPGGAAKPDAGQSVKAGDVLKLYVPGRPELSTNLTVPLDGYVVFPLIGRMRAGGVDLPELEKELSVAYARVFLDAPRVYVTREIRQSARQMVYVLGAVVRPHAYPIPESGELSLLQLISLCGGLTADALGDQVKVYRKTGNTATDRTVITVPVSSLVRGEGIVQDVILAPDDVIVVPRSTGVRVLGEVAKPGRYPPPVERQATISEMIALAGGNTEHADLARVLVARGDEGPEGGRTIVDLMPYLRGTANKKEPTVESGDMIVVPKSRSIHIIGQVSRPGAYALPPIREVTVAEAVTLAGGFAENADLTGIIVRRQGKDDKRIDIPVSALASRSESRGGDVVVLPGDVIDVPVRRKMYIMGRVRQPGAYSAPVLRALSVTEAITLAGGFTEEADPSSVTITREGADGKRTRIAVDTLMADVSGKGGETLVLPGDVVMVPTAQKVYVAGRVQRPGAYVLPRGRQTTLKEAITLAGGLEEDADLSRVAIKTIAPDGRRARVVLNATGSDRADKVLDTPIRPGDLVDVPPIQKIYVVGQVMRSGAFVVRAGTKITLSQAIALAGGFGDSPDLEKIRIIRKLPDGTRTTTKVNFKAFTKKMDLTQDPELQPGDTVYVPEGIW